MSKLVPGGGSNRIAFCSLFLILICASCSNVYWPAHGHGGMSEERPHAVHWHYCRCDIDQMAADIRQAELDIMALKQNGMKDNMPALLQKLERQSALTQREFTAHFYRDAERNLRKLNEGINKAQKLY